MPRYSTADRTALIIIPLLFLGCSLFPQASDYDYYPMYPGEISSVEHGGIGESISFEIESAFNSSCGDYSHADIKKTDFDLFVRFYQRREKGSVCATVMVPTQIHWRFNPITAGEYNFHFWRSDSTSLDTTIMIP